jgi:anti-sigma factor RsiW
MIGPRLHDPERNAALYVSGEMGGRERRRFEAHTLGCDDCWREVSLGRQGRGLALASRDVAPPDLRESVEAAISLTSARARLPRKPVVVAASIAVLLTVAAIGVEEVRSHAQPPPISAAITAARTAMLTTRGPSVHPAPDLSSQGLRLIMAERVDLSGLVSDAFMYGNDGGGSVLLFVSDFPFPEARGATPHATVGGGWQAQAEGMTMVCGHLPVNYLVVSENPSLVGPVERIVTTGPARG